MKKQMTVREIRRLLFETDKYTVIGEDEMTNKESRDFLYAIDNQDKTYNVIDEGSHLLIWK
jgi:chemotaxis regulatin CheY-phosphate phosphatase CheZ